MKSLIRLSAFISKEFHEVFRQPKLLLTLILGPFLIILLFGLGFKDQPDPLKAILVGDPQNQLVKELSADKKSFSDMIDIRETVAEGSDPKALLKQKNADLVILIPNDAVDTILSDKQAKISYYHNEVDSNKASYINYIGFILTERINQNIRLRAARQSQVNGAGLSIQLDMAIYNLSTTRGALERDDIISANASKAALRQNLASIRQTLAIMSSLGTASDHLALIDEISNDPAVQKDSVAGADHTSDIRALENRQRQLMGIREDVKRFDKISPLVMTTPFTYSASNVEKKDISATNFFVPLVIVLLLQHMSVTMSALSIVRERRSGIFEFFKVSPLKAASMLISKYIAHLLIGAIIGAVLVLAMKYGLNATMSGSWIHLSIVLISLIFASLGLGTLISLIAKTESEAVQFSMMTLLFSVFFSGFFVGLDYLSYPVRYVSNALPATYANRLLQDVMLRGSGLNMQFLVMLLGIGALLFLLDILILRYKLRKN